MALFKEYEVIKILEIMAESSFDELHLEMGELKLIEEKYAKPRGIDVRAIEHLPSRGGFEWYGKEE